MPACFSMLLSVPIGKSPAPVVPLRKRDVCYQFASGSQFPKDEAPDRPRNSRKIRGLQWSGRLDLNQRPLAPQAGPEAAQPSSILPNPSESFGSSSTLSVQGSQDFATLRRSFATNLLPPIEQLLTVRQVSQLLGVCTATVYKWAASGILPHVRIVNSIRISAPMWRAVFEEHLRCHR
jgi:excisionase family DNA binding protein